MSRMWTKKDGSEIRIADMSTEHIKNSLAMIDRNFKPIYSEEGYIIRDSPSDIPQYVWLEEEFRRRETLESFENKSTTAMVELEKRVKVLERWTEDKDSAWMED